MKAIIPWVLLLCFLSFLHAQEIYFGLPAAKNAKPDLSKFEGILEAKLLKEPIRPVDVTANPNAWEGRFMERYADTNLFNYGTFVAVKGSDDRLMHLYTRQKNTSRAKVLACITELFKLYGQPTKYVMDDPEDQAYQDYMGFVWSGDGAQVLFAIRTGEKFPWEGVIVASGSKEDAFTPIKSEMRGAKEIPRPADLKGTITTFLQKIKDE